MTHCFRLAAIVLAASIPLHSIAAQDNAAGPANCADVQEQARGIREVLAPPVGMPPQLRRWGGLRELAPAGDRGKTVRLQLRVDENGEPVASSIKFSGIFDVGLENRLRQVARNAQFGAATMSGCRVEGAFEGTIRILANGGINTLEWRRPPRTATGNEPPPPRLGDECAPQRDRARGGVLEPKETGGYKPPKPLQIFIPPLPLPPNVRGNTVEFTAVIDSAGRIVKDSASLSGVAHNGYAKDMYNQMLKMRFAPASLDGCAVEGSFYMRMQL